MLHNVFFYLLVIGGAYTIPLVDKYRKMAGIFFIALLGIAFADFFDAYQLKTADSFSLFWLSTQKYRIDINIDSYENAYLRVMPVFVMSILMAIYVSFFVKEKEDRRVYSLIALNLANMIILVCSKNLAQLLTCVCMADLCSQLMLKNFSSSKKYIFYSLFADIGLLMIFAMIQGKLKSFNLETVSSYKKIGRHKDFVVIASFLFIFVKMGFFMFQSALLDLRNVKSTKLIFVVSMSGVLAGFFALTKMYPLLAIADYSDKTVLVMTCLTAIWGALCCVIMAGTNQKIVYFNMFTHALALYIFLVKKQYVEEISLFIILSFLTSVYLTLKDKYPVYVAKAVLLGLWGVLLLYARIPNDPIYIGFSAVAMVVVGLSDSISYFYKFKKLQNADLFSDFYDNFLVRPLMVLGRALWILVDFMILERQVGASVVAAGEASSNYIEDLRESPTFVRVLFLLLMLAVFAASFYVEGFF